MGPGSRIHGDLAEAEISNMQFDVHQVVRFARRVLLAWDDTVLPKSRDGMMQERMEDLRAALEPNV